MGPDLNRFAGVAFIIVLIAAAELSCNRHWISPAILPPPDKIGNALVDGFRSGDFWAPLGATIGHMIVGWGSACIVGVALGAFVGTTAIGRAYVAPTLEFLRPLPASALAPVALLLIGRNNTMIVAVIVFGAVWPIVLSSMHGFASVEPRLKEVSRVMHLTPSQAFWAISIPSAMPAIIAGARISIAIALILAVVAEIMASTGGLGDQLNLAERSYRTPELYAGVILVGLLGVVTNLALERFEAYLLRWKPAAARF